MNKPASLSAQMEIATSRQIANTVDVATRDMQSAFLELGYLLEQQAPPSTEITLSPVHWREPREHSDATLPRFAWISLAASLLCFVSWSAYQMPSITHGTRQHSLLAQHSPYHALANSTQSITPVAAIAWDDGAKWEAELQRTAEAMLTFQARSPDFAEHAATWLNASLQQIKSEMQSESM